MKKKTRLVLAGFIAYLIVEEPYIFEYAFSKWLDYKRSKKHKHSWSCKPNCTKGMLKIE